MSVASTETSSVDESSSNELRTSKASSDRHNAEASTANDALNATEALTSINSLEGSDGSAPIKRRDFSVSEKVELLIKYDALPRMSQSKAAKELGVSKQLVSRLLQQRADIMQAWLHNKDTNRKRKRCGKDEEVETALKEWFDHACAEGIQVTGPIMRKKAEELAKKLGKEDFVATDGWFSRWRKRENIILLGRPRSEQSISEGPAGQWPEMLASYSAECVYGAEGTVTKDQKLDAQSHSSSFTHVDLNSLPQTPTTSLRAVVQQCPSKRRDLSISEKLELLLKYDALPQMSQSQAASQLGVSQPLLCKILKTRLDIEQESLQNSSRKRKRSGKDGEVETALKEWFDGAQKEGVSLTGPIMRKKAEELARELGKEDFVATDGWFNRWRKRVNITTGKTRSLNESTQSKGLTIDDNFYVPFEIDNYENNFIKESKQKSFLMADTNTPSVEVAPQRPVLPAECVNVNNSHLEVDVKPVITSTTSDENGPHWYLNPENETASLLISHSPNSIFSVEVLGITYLSKHSFVEERNDDLSRERLSVLCCVNLCGSKQKLLIVGQQDNRAFFRNVRHLPVEYYFNDEARVTPHIIFDWLIKWDRTLDHEIVLMMDDCQDLSSITSFKNLKFMPVPDSLRTSETSISQTLKSQFAELKRQRAEWLDLGSDDYDEILPSTVPNAISRSTSFLELLHIVAQSWEEVPSSRIIALFLKCGLLADSGCPPSPQKSPCGYDGESRIKMETCDTESTLDLIVDQRNTPPPSNEEIEKILTDLNRFVYHRADNFHLHYQYEKFIHSLL